MNTNNCNQNNYFKKLMKVVYLLPFLLLNSYVTATQPCPFDTGANTSMMIVAALAGFMVLFVWVLFCIKKYKILLRNSHKVLLIVVLLK